nr:hypothetical protein [uncultured Allomuricauda sp.]
MIKKVFELPGIVSCSLEYLTDSKHLRTLENYPDALRAVCVPKKRIGIHQASSYLNFDQIQLILDELKTIVKDNSLFYRHFEIDFGRHRIGPITGSKGNIPSFWLRPGIEVLPLRYVDLNDRNRRTAEIFLTNRMNDAKVPFGDHESVSELLTSWNPVINFKAGLMSCFSKADGKTIDRMVIDRINSGNFS